MQATRRSSATETVSADQQIVDQGSSISYCKKWLMIQCKLIDCLVNFKAALNYIKKQYTRLTRLNISDDAIKDLYEEGVLTSGEKRKIQKKDIIDRMEYLLDDVITPSLQAEVGEKFISLIRVMKNSDDVSLNKMASKLMEYLS